MITLLIIACCLIRHRCLCVSCFSRIWRNLAVRRQATYQISSRRRQRGISPTSSIVLDSFPRQSIAPLKTESSTAPPVPVIPPGDIDQPTTCVSPKSPTTQTLPKALSFQASLKSEVLERKALLRSSSTNNPIALGGGLKVAVPNVGNRSFRYGAGNCLIE